MPHSPCTSVCSPYTICSPCHGDLGSIVHPICNGVFWGPSVHMSGISVAVSTSISLSVHKSHTSWSPSLLVAPLLDWMPVDICYASCCCSLLVFSLCPKLLLPQLWLLLHWLLCSPMHHLCSEQLPLTPSLMGLQQHWVNMMWFCHHHWHQGTLEVLLVMPLWCSSNLHLRCLFRLMPIMLPVLHR